jgi:flagellar basal body-associated protein FliL
LLRKTKEKKKKELKKRKPELRNRFELYFSFEKKIQLNTGFCFNSIYS